MHIPTTLPSIEEETEKLGFSMASERETGSLLRALVASKPGGRILELGTGTGLSGCWLLDGMDTDSRLTTVDNDEQVLGVARKYLDDDPRIRIICSDGGEFLESLTDERFDMIFGDAWPGKFSHLDLAIDHLSHGGLYVIDDLQPQPSWPDGHAPRVPKLVAELKKREDLAIVELAWATGIIIATRN
jgi:predicted O-methyltransferase YrrM